MEMRDEIMNEFYDNGKNLRKWNHGKKYGYKTCPLCGRTNIEHLTRSSWWWFYFRCNDCNEVMVYSHGDKQGGQPDGIFKSSTVDLEAEKNGKYKYDIFDVPRPKKEYYTPTLEEFRKGFRYQELEYIYTDKGWYKTKENKWLIKVYNPNDYSEVYYLYDRIKRGLFNSIRVKKLDEGDILSLGFEYSPPNLAYHLRNTASYDLYIDVYIKRITQHNKVIITKEIFKDSKLFNSNTVELELKNKSELEDILVKMNIKIDKNM